MEVNVHWKNGGRIFFVLVFLMGSAGWSATVSSQINPNIVQVGERAVIQITVRDAKKVAPDYIPNIPGLKIEYSGMSSSYNWVNGKKWSAKILQYSVFGLKEGVYKISGLTLNVDGNNLTIDTVSLTVSNENSGAMVNGNGSDAVIKGVVRSVRSEVYAGEPLVIRYYLKGSSGINKIMQSSFTQPPEGKGIMISSLDEKLSPVVENGTELDYLVSFVATPQLAGNASISSSLLELVVMKDSDNFFGMSAPEQVVVQFEGIGFRVKALPSQGKPAEFSGIIGNYTMEISDDGSNLTQYTEKRIGVKISGNGNFKTVKHPDFTRTTDDVKVIYENKGDNVNSAEGKEEGSKEFQITLIPEKTGDVDLGVLRLAFFNPETGRYQIIDSKPFKFNVTEATASVADNSFVKSDKSIKSPLFVILIIIALILVVSGIIIFIIIHEKRSYHLAEITIPEKKKNESVSVKKNIDAQSSDLEIIEIENLLRLNKSKDFLNRVERYIAKLEETGLTADSAQLEIDSLKNVLFQSRYGGRDLNSNELQEIFDKIKSLKNAVSV